MQTDTAASPHRDLPRQVIAVDIDNVIGDTDSVVRSIIQREFGVEVKRDDITSWRYSTSLPITEAQELYALDTLHTSYLQSIPLNPGAGAALSELSLLAPIWLVTARPSWCRSDTEAWLEKIGVVYDELVFSLSKETIKVDTLFYVEDNGETAQVLVGLSKRVLLMDRPWNHRLPDHPLLLRVKSWDEITQFARSLALAR